MCRSPCRNGVDANHLPRFGLLDCYVDD